MRKAWIMPQNHQKLTDANDQMWWLCYSHANLKLVVRIRGFKKDFLSECEQSRNRRGDSHCI